MENAPEFDAKEWFYKWSKKNMFRGKFLAGRSHPMRAGVLALMLEDATEVYSGVPNYEHLTVKEKTSLGSIAGHCRNNALKIVKEKSRPSGISKALIEKVYLKEKAQERYDNFVKNLFDPESAKKKRALQRKQTSARKAAERKAGRDLRTTTPDFSEGAELPQSENESNSANDSGEEEV